MYGTMHSHLWDSAHAQMETVTMNIFDVKEAALIEASRIQRKAFGMTSTATFQGGRQYENHH